MGCFLMNEIVESSRKFSEQKVTEMRSVLAGLIPEGCGVFTFGSFARREASQESDIDYIIVSKEGFGSEHDLKPFVDEVDVALKSVVAVAPAQNGPFGKHVSINEMLTNLGGENDGNENITRSL